MAELEWSENERNCMTSKYDRWCQSFVERSEKQRRFHNPIKEAIDHLLNHRYEQSQEIMRSVGETLEIKTHYHKYKKLLNAKKKYDAAFDELRRLLEDDERFFGCFIGYIDPRLKVDQTKTTK